MEFKLNKTQRQVVNAAAKGVGQSALHCIHVRKGIVEAANGFILVQRKIDYEGDEQILLNIDQLKGHTDDKLLGAVVYTRQPGTDKVVASGVSVYTFNAQQGTFPQTNVLYPTSAPVVQFALGRLQLINLLKCLDKDEEHIAFSYYGKVMPLTFVVEGGEVKGLIMPRYIKEEGA